MIKLWCSSIVRRRRPKGATSELAQALPSTLQDCLDSRWTQLCRMQFRWRDSAHTNALEMRAYRSSFNSDCAVTKNIGTTFLHLLDSQVAIITEVAPVFVTCVSSWLLCEGHERASSLDELDQHFCWYCKHLWFDGEGRGVAR